MVLVFDLDDTLYDELSYVRSGFKVVASLIERVWRTPRDSAYNKMWETLLKDGRGRVFDSTLKYFNCYTKTNVKKCIYTYHLHKPTIKLDPEAKECLVRFRSRPLYVVTDGNKLVQKNKFHCLSGVKSLINFVKVFSFQRFFLVQNNGYVFQRQRIALYGV